VLLHGAWPDGSSWSKVIPLLEARGFHVVPVQNHLATFQDDIATTTRAIAVPKGIRMDFAQHLSDAEQTVRIAILTIKVVKATICSCSTFKSSMIRQRRRWLWSPCGVDSSRS
jgi:hypothetical protein